MIEWKSDYSVYRASFGGVINLCVAWESGGYKVSAHGATTIIKLKTPVLDLDEAKIQAIRLGRKLLAQAVESAKESK